MKNIFQRICINTCEESVITGLEFSSGSFSPSHNKHKIFYKSLSPNTKKEVTLIYVLHGLYDYHKSCLDLVSEWSRRSDSPLAFVLIDLPGHGQSGGKRGHISDFNDILSDLCEFFLTIDTISNLKISKRILFSQGIGGAFSLATFHRFENLLSKKIHSLVLCNPMLFPNEKVLPSGTSVRNLKGPFAKHLSRKRGHIAPFLSDNIERRFEFEADALVLGRVSFSYIKECHKLMGYIRSRGYYFEVPMLFLISQKASFIGPELIDLFYRGIASQKKKIKKIDSVFLEPYNSTKNINNKNLFFDSILDWVKSN